MHYVRKMFKMKNLIGVASICGFIYLLALLLNYMQGTI